jgi:uncharacterized membrane protein HdeD (DUF308 family)
MSDQFANPFTAGLNEIRSSWGWFLFFGIVMILCGAVCVVGSIAATWATIVVLGWLLLFTGVFALVQAFQVHTWNGFFIYLLSALLRGFTGYLMIRYPEVGAVSLTLIVASFFVVSGLFRAVAAGVLKFPYWGWSTFSGILTFALGIMLLTQLPVSSTWFLGFAVGVDMIFDGSSMLALASAVHKIPKLPSYRPTHA